MTKIMQGFKAVMSRGDDIRLDPDEVALVQEGAKRGLMVQVKQGIINPSFLVSIIEDKTREIRYTPGFTHERRSLGMEPLRNLLEMPIERVQLGGGN